MLIATQAIERSQLPLHLMPASRVLLGLFAPVAGAAAAWLIALAAGNSYSATEYEAVVFGAWLVTALGAWIKVRLEDGLEARIAVVGPREFAADFVAELERGRACARTTSSAGSARRARPSTARMRWLGTLEDVRSAVIAESIDLIVCAPGAGDAGGARLESICAQVADDCLDLPVRLIAANQLYEEVFGHVPVGMIDAAWYRYIMHPRFRAAGPYSKRAFDLVLGSMMAICFAPIVLAAAIAIKISDHGPIFYRQRRLGALRRGVRHPQAEDDARRRGGRRPAAGRKPGTPA